MKKIIGLLLVLVLLIGTTTMVFAEETELTLEEEIAVLEQTISNLEEYLLTEGLTEEEVESATTDLLGSETLLGVLNTRLEEKVKLEIISSMEAKLLVMEIELVALEAIDTSEFTEDELQSHQEALDALIRKPSVATLTHCIGILVEHFQHEESLMKTSKFGRPNEEFSPFANHVKDHERILDIGFKELGKHQSDQGACETGQA